ncbi:MAG TPA: dihydrolipoamide acetyltransferase family protein [Acidimicrobiales bacterium]|nr:dihydrolipoamide acetyltransferase family protein [Acidimicrobiales bacterium]
MADITMPQLGETVTEGTITRWLKRVGDQVELDDPLFEVSTDKVDSEVPSPFAGVLAEILVPEGQTVEVGARLAVIGDSVQDTAAPPAPGAPPATPPPPVASSAPLSPPPTVPPVRVPSDEVAEEDGALGALLSPVVRRLIRDNGLDPAQISGTGLGGRITRDDVLAHLGAVSSVVAVTTRPPAAPATPAPTAPAAQPMEQPAVSTPPAPLGVRDEIVPFTAVRRVTAEHMVRSIATSVHTLVAVEADFENVERVRSALKSQFKEEEGIGLTYLPFVARAVIDVLRDYPNLNSSVGEDVLIVHHDIHLGIAVDLQREGLIVPVVHNADGQSLRGIARSIADLAARARSRKLSADDITGGTFTITNPGPFGTLITAPIIAQPQVAILSTDGVKRKPIVVVTADGSESIAIHSVGVLALVFDHRAVDGAYASSFVRDVTKVIETRDWLAEL